MYKYLLGMAAGISVVPFFYLAQTTNSKEITFYFLIVGAPLGIIFFTAYAAYKQDKKDKKDKKESANNI